MTTETDIPPCPDPNAYAFVVWKADRRTKTGWRKIEEFTESFATEADVTQFVRQEEDRTGTRIESHKFWVLKHSYMSPHKAFWERWNTPHSCSAASETYWSS